MAAEEEIILTYTADTKSATANVEKLGEENDQTADAVGDVNSQLDEMPGAAGSAVKGVKALSASFKALLANPIVLIIAAIVGGLTLLFKAFKRTALGGDTMSKVFEGLDAIIGPVLDSLSKFVNIMMNFDWNNITGSISAMGSAFDGLGDEIQIAWENASKLVDLRRELREMTRELVEGESELVLQMDQQRAILDDISVSIEDRIAANNKLNDLNKELLASRQALIDKQLEEAQLQKAQAGLDDDALQEALDRIAELNAARNNAEAERFRIEKEFVTKRNDLLNQELAQGIERQRIRDEMANEQFRVDEDRKAEQFATSLDRVKEQSIQEIQVEEDLAMRKIAIQKDFTDETRHLTEERGRTEEEEFALRVDLANKSAQLLGALAGLAGKNVKLQKTLAISSAVIATLTAGAQVLADPSAITPIQKAISLATILATGFATVSRIASTKITGQGGSTGFTRPSLSSSISSSNNGFQNTNPNLAQDVALVNQEEQPPIRAIVMEGDITSAQEASKAAQEKSGF